MKTINIALAEDNLNLRQSISKIIGLFSDLNLKIVSENGKELISALQKSSNIHVILMDIEMPVMNGIEATKIIKRQYPQIKIIMLTVFDNEENIYNAIKNGANGYILKEAEPEQLYQSIKKVYESDVAFSDKILTKTIDLLRLANLSNLENISNVPDISEREKEVLIQLSKGLKYNSIAENLLLSEGTVRKHVEKIYRKLGVSNKVEAIIKAKELKLIQ